MLPLKIGACLRIDEIAQHRNWLFDADRDIEIQDFTSHTALLHSRKDIVNAALQALEGYTGRIGIHGPYEGLDIDNKDPAIQSIITERFLLAMEAAEAIGARQMVLHSPYTLWFQNNIHNWPGYGEAKLNRIHRILVPVVKRAEETGIQLVIENIQDVDPSMRRKLAESFDSQMVSLSVDTGHAQLARRMSGAPPVDYFIRDAGLLLDHVHLQDVDGHADRHSPPGEGEIEWPAVFRAIADSGSSPHLVLELRDKAKMTEGFAYLESLGLAE